MMKWFRRLIVYPISVLIVLIVVFLFFNKELYINLKGFYATNLQWYGYEEKGNGIIENALNYFNERRPELYHAFSVQNTKNGNYDEAIKYLNKAAQLDPANADGYFGWCLLYYYRDYDKALFHLNRIDSSTNYVDYVGDDNILYAKGLCYKQKGNYPIALELFKKAIDHEIKTFGESSINHLMFFQTGRILSLMDRHLEAIEYYNRAINNWEGSSESIYYKALSELELGIETGCKNLELALQKVKKGTKSSDPYVKLFDEIYVEQVEETITLKCKK